MKYPTKHQQYAYEVGLYLGFCLVGIIAGVGLGWLFAVCFRAVARGVL